MNKWTFAWLLGILLIIILIGTIVYRKDNVEDLTELKDDNNIVETNTNEEVVDEQTVSGTNNKTKSDVQSYTFTNEFGDNTKKVTFNAKQVVQLEGFPGASSNVYYIGEDNKLYYLELSNLTQTPISTNIDHLELKEKVIAYYNEPHEILNNSQYVEYQKND